ncbi:MAG: phosphotransferase enzyme family protein [Mycobacteriales bacterium]|nr:MAG: hypothetical protein DLM56_06365 [Pseudonocardiales bacterium]
MRLDEQILERYGVVVDGCELIHHLVHDVMRVESGTQRFALKLYRQGVRSVEDVQWELDLTRHLAALGAPVVHPSCPEPRRLTIDGVERLTALTSWAPGIKPSPSVATYELLGGAAAAIHAAADSFPQQPTPRQGHSAATLIDRPLALMRTELSEIGRYDDVAALARQLGEHLRGGVLDRGICHNDLTLDNVHVEENSMTVFDFDSARVSWRAAEPGGVFAWAQQSDPEYWRAWLTGYRAVRTFDASAEQAVAWFALIGEFDIVAWKLGLTPTAAGRRLSAGGLRDVVDRWLDSAARTT